jgi:hypothetical protein
MSAIHTLSEEDLMKAAAIPARKTKDITWRGQTITIKERLPLQEYLTLIRNIIKSVEDPDGNIVYEAVIFAIRANIIGTYAFIDLPKEAQALYDLILCTDLYEQIVQNIHAEQLRDLMDSIYMYVGMRGDANGHD